MLELTASPCFYAFKKFIQAGRAREFGVLPAFYFADTLEDASADPLFFDSGEVGERVFQGDLSYSLRSQFLFLHAAQRITHHFAGVVVTAALDSGLHIVRQMVGD
jgi:hypothetical protein